MSWPTLPDSLLRVDELKFHGCGHDLGAPALEDLGTWFEPVELTPELLERAIAGMSLGNALPRKAWSCSGWLSGDPRPLRDFESQLGQLRQSPTVEVSYTESQATTTRRAAVVRAWTRLDHAAGVLDFALDFIAPDPRRYGPVVWSTHAARSVFEVTNHGTAPSPLSLRLTRSGDTQTITVPGAASTFTRSLSGGSLLWMDGERMETYLDGSRAAGMRAIRWPTVPPRSTVSVTVTGASAWSVGVRDAWW